MDLVTRDADLVPCPHCGHELRKGMIRCRECNGVVNEDFVLAADVVAVDAPVHRCSKCGTTLEPGIDDCPGCASAMLDALLSATPEGAGDVPARPTANLRPAGNSVSRLREYTPAPMPERDAPAEEKREKSNPRPTGKGKGKRRGAAARGADAADDETGTDALYESDTDVRAVRAGATVPEIARPAESAPSEDPEAPEAAAIPEEAASAACQSLLSALATPDADALCKVVTALGKLGDKSAQGPLERLMINPDIRVRRATAEALISLGHPKGKALYDIAERKIAALPASAGASYSKPKKSARAPMDWDALKKPALAVLGVAILGGGIWFWQTKGSGPKIAKRVSSAKAAAANRLKNQSTKGAAPAPKPAGGASAFDN